MSKRVGTVLQDTNGQFIGLTVAEDLAFALENDATPQDEMFRKVDRVADIVDMKHFLRHSPSALSGGQKHRVSAGGVLVDDVKILLFDEPLANLDPATGKNTIALIDDICRREDVTVVIIEHRVEDVLYRDVGSGLWSWTTAKSWLTTIPTGCCARMCCPAPASGSRFM